jgi:hypothetical protein
MKAVRGNANEVFMQSHGRTVAGGALFFRGVVENFSHTSNSHT